MSLFTVTLKGLPDLSPEMREDAEIRYRDTLGMALGSEANVIGACLAHNEVVARYPGEALPLGRTVGEKAAVSRWWAADRAAEMAAFVPWAVHPREAWFEVRV